MVHAWFVFGAAVTVKQIYCLLILITDTVFIKHNLIPDYNQHIYAIARPAS